MARCTVKRAGGKKGWGDSPDLRRYLQESQRPIVILAFLAPAIILYQIGSGVYSTDIVAFAILRDMMAYLGVYGRSVPAILLVLTLLGWHLVKRDRWEFRLSILAKMLLESVLMALPVFAIGILARHSPLMAVGNPHLGAKLALSLGAGLYEELVFRVYLCGLLWLIIAKGLGVGRFWATVLVVLVSAVLFSAYHYLGRGEHFVTNVFIFRMLAGVYFAGLYMARGLGVTAGAHAVYDVIVVALAGL